MVSRDQSGGSLTKPCRQEGIRGSQPSSAFAFAFDAPRSSVIVAIP